MSDLDPILWKEWRALFRQRENRLRVLLSTLTPIVFLGVVLPYQAGPRWLTGAPSVLASFVVPVLFALLAVPDAFAGERERHTLPTLLATRLSDGAILYGKTLFALALGWGGTWGILFLGLFAANASPRVGEFTGYAPLVLAADLCLSLAVGVLAVWAGVLVSLRARTVLGAQQTLTALLMLPPMLLGPVVLLVSELAPRLRPKALVAELGPWRVLGVVLAVLVVVDAVLVVAVARRFRRDRLVAS